MAREIIMNPDRTETALIQNDSCTRSCRVCGFEFAKPSILRMNEMPKSAQFLPGEMELSFDKGITLELFQCMSCGLAQLNTPPVPYYREVIRSAAFSDEMKAFRCTQFDAFVSDYNLVGRKIIEVGCGRGEYLKLMRETGAEVFGIEASSEAVLQCCQEGLQVSSRFIDSPDCFLEGAPFNAFFMLNFLEHLPDPVGTLRGICSNLEDDGIGLVEVPNFDMVLRNNLFTELTSDHLLYFTSKTLETLLTLSGFEVVECRAVWYDYILSAVVRKRASCNASAFGDAQMSLEADVASFIESSKSGSVAIWGAGHQALTIMALLKLAGKVKYVVDSAPFKQGKFTPATHIPIVPPSRLISDPVDAVIVMAASYSDEVAQILRKSYNDVEKVAILRDSRLEYV